MFIEFADRLVNLRHVKIIKYFNPADDGIEDIDDKQGRIILQGDGFNLVEKFDNWVFAQEKYKMLRQYLPMLNYNDLGIF